MKLTQVGTPNVDLVVNDFFVAETSVFGHFDLRQVIRTEKGYGILCISSGKVYATNSQSVEEALEGYKNIKEVKLEEVSYSVL